MAVPNTNTFSLQDVVNEVNPSSNDLITCFDGSYEAGFDDSYIPSGFDPHTSDKSGYELYYFRNYEHYPFINSDDQGTAYKSVYGDGTWIFTVSRIDGRYCYTSDNQLTLADSDSATGVDVYADSDFVYITALVGGGLFVCSVDINGNLTTEDQDFRGSDSYFGVSGDSNYIYVACGYDGVRSYSVDINGNLTFIDRNDLGGTHEKVYKAVNYLYAACRGGGIRTYDITSNGNIVFIDSHYRDGDYVNIFGYGVYAFVAAGDGGVKLYQISSNGTVYFKNEYYQGNSCNGVWCDSNGDYVYVATIGGIEVYSLDYNNGTLFFEEIYDTGYSFNDVWGDNNDYLWGVGPFGIRLYEQKK